MPLPPAEPARDPFWSKLNKGAPGGDDAMIGMGDAPPTAEDLLEEAIPYLEKDPAAADLVARIRQLIPPAGPEMGDAAPPVDMPVPAAGS